MAIAWIAPAALLGIALIALPIAIHLLVRQHARTLAYPSLRFLRETQLAAFRRRTIQDAALLLCRAAIIALAAVALAGPVLQLASRTAGYASRTSRAVVLIGVSVDAVPASTGEGAFAAATLARSAVSDALADAMRWLDQQPRSSREVVLYGTLRRGSVTDADLSRIPPEIGIRFEPVAGSSSNDVTWPVLTRRNGSLVRLDRAVYLDTDATRMADGGTTPLPDDLITIAASEADLPLAQAALRAALDAGVAWSDFDRRVVIAWDNADPAALNRTPAGAQIVRMPAPSPPSSAADAVLAALETVSPRPDHLEPVMITPEQLSAWSRAPGPPSATAPLADEGDRRWLWGAVLALLALETWLRRSTAGGKRERSLETRVA